MRTVFIFVVFIGDPLTALLGFLMFRYPQAWAKMNARLSRGQLCDFDSPKQLASTRRLGALMMIFAAFSAFSLLAVFGMAPKLLMPQ
jgi:hypothetical protein